MRALIKRNPDIGYELDDNVEIAAPIEDECQIRVKAVSICGSGTLHTNHY